MKSLYSLLIIIYIAYCYSKPIEDKIFSHISIFSYYKITYSLSDILLRKNGGQKAMGQHMQHIQSNESKKN